MKKKILWLLILGLMFLLSGCDLEDFISQPQEKTYSIQYGLGGGTFEGEAVREYQIKDLPLELPEPIKEGSSFLGWYRSNDFSGEPVNMLEEGTTGNIILYARWEEEATIVEYEITYILDGGTVEGIFKFTEDDLPLTLPTPTKSGHAFDGWYLDEDFAIQITEIKEANNYTLYAKWVAEDVYTITYHLNGGINHLNNPTTLNPAVLPFTLFTPTRDGFKFLGWYLSSDLNGEAITIIETITNDIAIYAKWEVLGEQEYNITYHLNGGINHPNNPTYYKASNLPIAIQTPSRDGYAFVGWYLTSDYSGDIITSFTKSTSGNKTLYAKWERLAEQEYSITYYLNGGINHPNNPTHYKASNLPIAIQMPSRDGYAFVGWYLSSDYSGNNITGFIQGTTGNKTLYAKWEQLTQLNVEILVEIAEHSRLQSDFDIAYQAINDLADESLKQTLLNRINQIVIIEDDVIRDDSTIID